MPNTHIFVLYLELNVQLYQRAPENAIKCKTQHQIQSIQTVLGPDKKVRVFQIVFQQKSG